MLRKSTTLLLFAVFYTVSFFSANAQITRTPCLENYDFHVVILGSSTAAGSGPSHSDSAWVNRYRHALQTINPDITVTNLAVGGYTTYKIMPDSFVAPSNRPVRDSLHNITKALSLNPDVIIVNLPSNDRNWPMSEQLSNFDSLYNHSWNNGVPMYICTTQPITTSGPYQRAVRDSILANFAPHAIEFFTPIATTNNTVDTTYAADAVHLNDKGHAILFRQVWNKDLLIDVLPDAIGTDINLVGIIPPADHCPSNQSSIGWIVSNAGFTPISDTIGYGAYEINQIVDSVPIILNDTLFTCTVDTIYTSLPLNTVGNYHFHARLSIANDTILANNYGSELYYTVQSTQTLTDSIVFSCPQQLYTLPQTGYVGDTLLWFAQNNTSQPITSIQQTFTLNNDTTLFHRAVSGDTRYRETIYPVRSNSISYNGNMFNLYADTALTVTKMSFISVQAGMVYYSIYTTSGSYKGKESTSTAWTLHHTDSALVSNALDVVEFDVQIGMNTNDTTGVYIHLGSGQTLRYRGLNAPSSTVGKHLTYLSGSGIAYRFGASYANRVLDGLIEYAYGFNPDGECATPLKAFTVRVDTSEIDVLPNVSIQGDSLQIDPSFHNVVWTNTATGDTLSTASTLALDSLTLTTLLEVYVEGTSALGCFYNDTIVLIVVNYLSLTDYTTYWKVYPNPARDILNVTHTQQDELYQVYSTTGRLILEGECSANQTEIPLHELSSGSYVLRVFTDGRPQSTLFVVSE